MIPISKMTAVTYTRLGVVLAVLVSFMLGAVSVTALSAIIKTSDDTRLCDSIGNEEK